MSPDPVKSSPRTFVIDLSERVITTFAQVFLSSLLAITGMQVMWGQAAAVAGFAAAGSFLTTVLVWMGAIKIIENPYLDLAYRGGVTFLQTLLGVIAAAGAISALDFNWNLALKAALVATGYSLLKGLIGLNNPASLGASPITKNPDGRRLVYVVDDPAGNHRPSPRPHVE